MARMVIFAASYPDVSPSRWKFARKGRREEENGRGRRLCLSSFSIPWSIALRQQSLAFSRFKPLCEKRSVWGGSSYFYISTFFLFSFFISILYLPWAVRAMTTPHRSMNEWALPSWQRSRARSRAECKFYDQFFLSHLRHFVEKVIFTIPT